MTSEGGGKFKQKRNRNTKPYERPKSILNRVGDVVRNVLTPSSWVPSLVSWSRGDVEEVEVEETTSSVGGASTTNHSSSSLLQNPSQIKVVATSRCSLNSLPGPSGVTTSRANNNNENHNKKTQKHRIPLESRVESNSSSSSFWNPASEERHETISSRLDDHGFDIVAGPSTSTPFVSPNPVPFSRESSFPTRRNVERTNGRASLQPPPPSSRNVYAKLRDIGKLSNEDVSHDEQRTTERREIENSANLAGGNDSHSECSEESVSTSGCSSMVPHPDKREYQKDVLDINNKSGIQRLPSDDQMGFDRRNNDSINFEGTRSVFDRSIGLSNSFLFSERSQSQISKPQPPPPSNRPQFNSFLFGSPVWSEKTSPKDNDSLQSTPYSNKASYGFGSSYRRARLNATNPYSVSSSAQRHIRVKTAKNAELDVMSTTAKRILETLEKMSTPITDAKRIPSLKQDPVQDTPLTFTASAYRRRPNLSMKNNGPNITRIEATNKTTPPVGPPVSKLMTSGSAAVTRTYLRNVDLEPSKVINAVTKPMESASKPPAHRAEIQTKAGGKMKVQHRSGLHYSKSNGSNDILDGPNLPSIPLPIQNLPKFNFFGNSSTSDSSTTSVAPKKVDPVDHSVKPSSSNTSEEPTSDVSSKFKFSSPIVKQAIDSALDNLRKQNVTNFTFSSPISVKDVVSNGKDPCEPTLQAIDKDPVPVVVVTSPATAPTFTFKAPTTTKPVLKMKPSPEKKDKSDEEEPSKPTAGIGVASQLKTGSVMDILGKKSLTEKPSSTVGKIDSTKSSNTSATFSSFVDKFKMVPGSWECPVCMVNNNESTQKCVACDKKKPIAKGNNSNVPTIAITPPASTSSTLEGFGDQFRSQTEGTWECPTCLLRVSENLTKCMSCETAKPKAVSTSKVSWAAESKQATTGMWECDICMVRNSADVPKCIACESNKPGTVAVSAPGSFKFGFTGAGVSNTSGSAPFKFGISSTATTTTTSTTTAVSSSLFSTAAATTTATTTTTSTFKFGLPSTVQTTIKTAATTTSPPTFSFGLAKTNSELSVTNNSTSVTSSPTVSLAFGNSVTSKVNVVPTIDSSESSKIVRKEESAATTTTDEKQQSSWNTPTFTFGVNKASSVEASEASVVSTSSSTSAVVPSDQTAQSQTYSFGSAKPATESAGGFTFGSSLRTAALPSSTTAAAASSAPLSSGGFSFKFGSSDAKKDSQSQLPPPPPASSATLQPPPVFSFGGAASSDSKNNALTTVIPVAVPTSTNALASQALSSGGGFQFKFGSSVAKKREAESDSDVTSKKIGVASSTSSFGVFGSNVAPSAGSFSFGTQAPSAAAPTGPIFGALSTVAEKAPSSNTFTFGANTSNNNSSTATACGPLFGSATKPTQLQFGAPKPQTTSTFTFGAAPTTVAPPVIAPAAPPALSTSTSSFAPFSFGMQGAGADGARASSGSLPSFGNVVGSTSAATPTFGASLQQSSSNVFGSQQPAAPTFGSFGNTALPGASVQGFGAAPVAPNGGGGGGSFGFSAAPAFQFGSSAPTQADTGVFTFTGSQSNAAAPVAPSNSGFPFNQQQQMAPPPNAGFNFNPSNQLNFSFGSGGQDQPPPTFTATQNPFDAHGSKRPIKKAKRRTQK